MFIVAKLNDAVVERSTYWYIVRPRIHTEHFKPPEMGSVAEAAIVFFVFVALQL